MKPSEFRAILEHSDRAVEALRKHSADIENKIRVATAHLREEEMCITNDMRDADEDGPERAAFIREAHIAREAAQEANRNFFCKHVDDEGKNALKVDSYFGSMSTHISCPFCKRIWQEI